LINYISSFSNGDGLWQHYRIKHLQQHIYTCSFCKWGVDEKLAMYTHMAAKHQAPKHFELFCPKGCGAIFSRRNLKKEHASQCDGQPAAKKPKLEQPGYKCRICAKAFENAKYMQQHCVLQHSREGDVYKCREESCFKRQTYSSLASIKHHYLTIHKDIPFPQQSYKDIDFTALYTKWVAELDNPNGMNGNSSSSTQNENHEQ